MFNDNSKVFNVDIDKEMRKSFLEYSMSVIVARALPDVRDGMKPVHRRIIYTMNDSKNTYDKPYRKCAYTVGEVLGKYHPHGDASVYDALVRLAQKFSLRYPLIDGHGNFGSIDGDPPAAYRYTEARMSKIAGEMLTDIEKETIPYTTNYDDKLKEPVVLPSRFPNLLVNGSVGIAVGMATNIPPHNLGEVIDAIDLVMDNPDCTLDEIMEHIKGPDFPTGGIIMGRAGIRAAYATGRGKITLRANTTIEEIKGRQCIIVHEIPYMVNKARLVESMANLVKDKRIDGVHFIRDESGREGMRIVVELKKDAIPQIVLNKLFSYTQLQDTVGVIMLALVDGEPKVLTLKQTIEQYIKFQVEVIRRRTEYDLKKAKHRAHILEGLVIAADNIDEVVEICKTSENIPHSKQRLQERFNLTEIQAEAIVQMTLGKLTGLERQKILDELDELMKKIEELEAILADENKVHQIIKDELAEIRRKYSDDRRTQIETVSGEVDIEDLIPVEDCVVTYTNIGYIKRMPVDVYKTQRRGGRGVSGMKQREEDFVNEMFICSTHDNILFITNKGIMYKLKCYEVPEGSKSSRGVNAVNLLPLSEDEKIAAMIKTSDFDEGKYVVMVTKNGKIKRTALSAYKNVRKNGLIAIGLDEGDEIAGVRMTDGSAQLFVATRNGMAIRLEEEKIRSMSRSAHGVKAIKLRDGDYVVSMARVREGASLLTVTDKGYGKRTELDAYRIQNRGGFGLLNYKTGEEKGYVCGIKVVDETDDIILISNDGIIIRIRCADVRIMGRYATGVKVMKVAEESRVVSFTRAEHDEEAEVETVDQPSEEEIAQDMANAQAEELENNTVEETEEPENSEE
ncbi:MULTISPECIES: DNA gyrase subunit A [Porcipelethomonas]|uniref:DNA gyrase subunit A n=1 Tax=Porcipelethomonas TaxID=2981643 RepID=UPI0008235675|nr:DNA gyrase subunit A [Porcipelethomonas ammoniilytica]MCU6719188.1 DNA gyrase subunit A [Porcipelethomonas ammoniilytica]SCI73070.1 DNA gyrase subunit A [uncultured Ruminococcus sp.]